MMFVRPKTILKLAPIALLTSSMLISAPASADELTPPRPLTEYEQELIQDATPEEKEMLFRAIALNEEANKEERGTLGQFRSSSPSSVYEDIEAYSKVPPAAKNTNPRTTENTRPYNPNGRLNPV